jgi:MFS family permease
MSGPRRELWTPIAGIAATVTFIVGVLMVGNSPEGSDSNAKVLAWYADRGHRTGVIIGAYVLMFFGLFLLWFAAGLRQRLRTAVGEDGRLANVALGGAVLCIALVWGGALALAAIPAGEAFGSEPAITNSDLARFLPQVGFGAILVGGMFGAIAMIDAASVVGLRTGLFPRWLVWLGFVCGVVLLFGAFFLPLIALPVWLIGMSVVLFRRPEESPTEGSRSAAVEPAP